MIRSGPFQSTHPSGVRPSRSDCSAIVRDFNPRTPVGCDALAHANQRYRAISIHAPQWGATFLVPYTWVMVIFQSTHPSGVRPGPAAAHGGGVRISIHAPQWGATHQNGHAYMRPDISIHAPQWGATKWITVNEVRARISIHAPQWGATVGARGVMLQLGEFQSTHPSGVRPTCSPADGRDTSFQSTHPSGVRLGHRLTISPDWGFQSTHPSGVRPHSRAWRCPRHHFNPRTPVGCDQLVDVRQAARRAFQSTHPSGVRPQLTMQSARTAAISIHAPQWGATRNST